MTGRAHIGLLALVFVVIFGGVPSFQAPDAHNFIAYYAIALFGVGLLPVHWTIKLFAGIAGASAVYIQIMIACVQPRSLAGLYGKLYLSANADFQFIMLFAGLYAMFMILRPGMTTWLNMLCAIAMIEVMRVSWMRLGWDPIYIPVNISDSITDAPGTQGNPGWTGMALAMCGPAFFRSRLWWGLAPIMGAMYILQSLTPVIALPGAVMVYALFKFRRSGAIIVVITAIVILGLYFLYDPSDSHRFVNCRRAWEICTERNLWFMGYGLGSWIMLFPEPGASFHRAHCEPLQVWFELGFMGVLAMLLYARFLILRFVRVVKRGAMSKHGLHAAAGMVTVILCSLGNFPFHLAGTAVLAVGWMAMFEKETAWQRW